MYDFPAENLSGGQRTRLALATLLLTDSKLIILDEPTNHMDIIGKESLENILKEYKGTLIFVSHDRYFVNKIADSLLIFNSNGVTYFNGTYTEYEEKQSKKFTWTWTFFDDNGRYCRMRKTADAQCGN